MTDSEHRRHALDRLAEFYARHLAEDGRDGTSFDCDVLDAIQALAERLCPEQPRPGTRP